MDFLALTKLFGYGLTAFSQFSGRQNEAKAYAYNESLAKSEAELSRRASELESTRLKKQAAAFGSRQEALYAKSGVKFEGSPLLVMADSQAEFELDDLTQKFNRQIEQRQADSKASQYGYAAGESKRLSLLEPLSTAIGSADTVYNLFNTKAAAK